MRLLSRSQIEARQRCPSYEYWAYRAGGLGLQRQTVSLPLVGGIQLHAALAEVLRGEVTPARITGAIVAAQQAYTAEVGARGVEGTDPAQLGELVQEQTWLLEGLVRGWLRFRWPVLAEDYTVVSIEEAWVYEVDRDLGLQMRMDLGLRHRYTGDLYVLDYKTTSQAGDQWQAGFEHSLQTVLYLAGMQRRHGEPAAGIIYEGLVTGGRRASKSGRWAGRRLQGSPLCYGYSNGKVHQVARTQAKGWEKVPAWETGLTCQEWCEQVVGDVRWRDLYWHVPPIVPTQRELLDEVYQVVQGELEQETRVADLPPWGHPDHWSEVQRQVPKHRQQCRPWQGGTCPMYELCYQRSVGEAPLESGLYVPRVPHHDLVTFEDTTVQESGQDEGGVVC